MTINEVHNAPGYAGVYCFKNKINGKCYIGQSIKLKQRFKEHWRNSSDPKYSNIVFYKAIAKYGWDNFELTILKEFRDALSWRTKGNLDYWEKYYIQEYDSYNNGYNSTLGGDGGVLGYKHTEETIEHLRQVSLEQAEIKRQEEAKDPNNWIKAKNLETGEIFTFKTRKEAEETLQLPSYVIKKCILKTYKIGYKKWQFVYYNEEFEELPEYDSDEFKELLYGQFKTLSNKEEILEYIKENPKCSYGEIKQTFELSRKTFYNYRKELGISFEQRIDTKITKEEFLVFYNEHPNKEECMKHFNIPEKRYYKYVEKYTK